MRQNLSIQKQSLSIKVGYNQMKTLLDIFDKNTTKSIETIKPIVYSGDTLMYIVDYANDKGWKIMSGDRRINPVLAEDSAGTFSLNDGSNPNLITWLAQGAEQIYNYRNIETIDSINENYILWQKIDTLCANLTNGRRKIVGDAYWSLISISSVDLPDISTGHLVKTEWGQSYPFNNCVPYTRGTDRCVAGCVAVSGAQMLYYLHYKINKPQSMYSQGACYGWSDSDASDYSFSFSNANTTCWDDMYLTYLDYAWAKNFTTPNEYAAILIGWVGNGINMEYSENASSANTSDLKTLFSTVGIISTYSSYNSSTIEQNISNGLPTIVRATSLVDPIKFLGIPVDYKHRDGHSWIIDGYVEKRKQYTYTYEWAVNGGNAPAPYSKQSKVITSELGVTKTTTSISTTNKYFLMNWGWSSLNNSGLFLYDDNWYIDFYKNGSFDYTANFKIDREMLYNFN